VKTGLERNLDEVFGGATVLRSKDLERRGFARSRIRAALDDEQLERVARGLYVRSGAGISENHSLALVARRVPRAAVCLLSALRFHELTSQNPHEVWVAVGPKDRKPALEYPSIRVVRFSLRNFGLGLEEHGVEGVPVRIYSVARTVVDLFRYRNKIGLDVALEALGDGWRERRFTMKEINRIAKLCRMERVMKPYMEALIA
jgi:predicted transcriptional regulator of viral defense system